MDNIKPIRISVIIPVYNVEPYLRQALGSVVNQTLKDIEIICVDDCSTDNSLEILMEYASKDGRITVLEQKENKGQGAARNRALDIAKGEVIMFLDPDDWYAYDACEKVYNQIINNNNDFVYINYRFCKETKKGRVYTCDNHLEGFFEKEVINSPNIKLWELKNNFWYNVNTVCRAYKREFLEQYNIRYDNNLRLCQDVPFFAKCIANALSVSIIMDELYVIRDREGSSSKTAKNYECVITSRRMAYDIIKNSKHAKDLEIPCLCYALTVLSHFSRLTKIDKRIRTDFYNKIKEFFTFLNEHENMDIIKEHSPRYEEFKTILKQPYSKYKIKKILQNFYSKKNVFDRGCKRQITKILGIKFKKEIREESIYKDKNKEYYTNKTINNKILNPEESACKK